MENTEQVEVKNTEETTPNQAVNTDKTANETEKHTEQHDSQPVNNDDFIMPDESHDSGEETLAPWMKDRIAREKRKADRKQQEIDDLNERLRQYESQGARNSNNQTFQNPQNTDTQNPEEIIRNLIRDEVNKAEQVKSQQTEAQKTAGFFSKFNRGYDKYPDFDLVKSHDVKITPLTIEYLKDLNDPEDFTYNLAKFNSDKLAAIANLSPAKQIVQLDNLYKSFSQKVKGKKFTNAPTPPDKVPTSSTVSDDWSSASFDQLRKMTKSKRR